MIEPGTLTTIVMLPTYDEAGNIKKLILEILDLNDSIGCVVVDDNSPDGTSSIVKELENKYHFVGEQLWLQDNKQLGIWGYPSAFVSNIHHHYCLIFYRNNIKLKQTDGANL